MSFLRPDLLVLAPLAAVLLALALGSRWRRLRRLAGAYDLPVLRRLLPVRLDRFPTARLLALIVAGSAIGLAAAGPVPARPEPAEPPPPLDVAVAVDLSLSMSARDVPPSRMARARAVIDTLTRELPSVRFSLVVFAGWPYALVPPTDDPSVVRWFADSLRVELVEELARGSSLSGTLALAGGTLESRAREGARRVVLVVSDGDVHEDERVLVEAASALADSDVEVWAAAVGTRTGMPLSVQGEPVLDGRGEPVTAPVSMELLQALVDAGAGRLEDVSTGSGLAELVADLRELSGDAAEEEGPAPDAAVLLTLLAIPLLLWEGAEDMGRGRLPWQKREGAP